MSDQTFISYSKKDSTFAHKLADDLLKAGCEVWIDRSIGGGEKWRQAIETHLKESKDVIIVVSPKSMASDWVRHEGSLAYGWGKKLYPILLEPISSLPPWLEEYQWVSFVNTPYEVAFEALLTALTPANPIQKLLDERVKGYQQTGELLGEEIIGVIENVRDKLAISAEAEEILQRSKQAIEKRQQRERAQTAAVHEAEKKQYAIRRKGRQAIGLLIVSFFATGLVSLLSLFPASTGWQRLHSLKLLTGGASDTYVITVDEKDPEAIFVSDYSPGGFYQATFKSDACWNKLEVVPNSNLVVSDITASRDAIYVVASDQLFASADGGTSWEQLRLPADNGAVIPAAVTVNPDDVQQVFVGTMPAGLFLYGTKDKQWQQIDLPVKDSLTIAALDHNGESLLLAVGQMIWVRGDNPPQWRLVLDGIKPIYDISMVGNEGRFFIVGGDQGILDADINSDQWHILVDSPPSTFIQSVTATNDARYAADQDGIWYWRLWPWTELNWLRFQFKQPIPCYE